MSHENFTGALTKIRIGELFDTSSFTRRFATQAVKNEVGKKQINAALIKVKCLDRSGNPRVPMFRRKDTPIIQLQETNGAQPEICTDCPYWDDGSCAIIQNELSKSSQ